MMNARLSRLVAAVATASALLASCVTDPPTVIVHKTAVEHGRWLFSSTTTSPASYNRYACATCHAATATDLQGRVLPGATLAGVIHRPTYWGGQQLELLTAINTCRAMFMGAPKPWSAQDDQAAAIYAWLASLPDEQTAAAPLTIVAPVVDLPQGNASRGKQLYAAACQHCHGAPHTGAGRLTSAASILPQGPRAEHAGFTPAQQRLVLIEKVRHGPFLGYGGTMPPFGQEALSDADLADLLTLLDP